MTAYRNDFLVVESTGSSGSGGEDGVEAFIGYFEPMVISSEILLDAEGDIVMGGVRYVP